MEQRQEQHGIMAQVERLIWTVAKSDYQLVVLILSIVPLAWFLALLPKHSAFILARSYDVMATTFAESTWAAIAGVLFGLLVLSATFLRHHVLWRWLHIFAVGGCCLWCVFVGLMQFAATRESPGAYIHGGAAVGFLLCMVRFIIDHVEDLIAPLPRLTLWRR